MCGFLDKLEASCTLGIATAAKSGVARSCFLSLSSICFHLSDYKDVLEIWQSLSLRKLCAGRLAAIKDRNEQWCMMEPTMANIRQGRAMNTMDSCPVRVMKQYPMSSLGCLCRNIKVDKQGMKKNGERSPKRKASIAVNVCYRWSTAYSERYTGYYMHYLSIRKI